MIESLCRSLNNLLEHLHQSFFFYFVLSPTGQNLGDPGRFISIGTYLPAAMIIAASFTITSIVLWIQCSTASAPPQSDKANSKKTKEVRSISIGFPLGVVASLHGLGFLILACFDWIQETPTVYSQVFALSLAVADNIEVDQLILFLHSIA